MPERPNKIETEKAVKRSGIVILHPFLKIKYEGVLTKNHFDQER